VIGDNNQDEEAGDPFQPKSVDARILDELRRVLGACGWRGSPPEPGQARRSSSPGKRSPIRLDAPHPLVGDVPPQETAP
jgi:hypothetical protein